MLVLVGFTMSQGQGVNARKEYHVDRAEQLRASIDDELAEVLPEPADSAESSLWKEETLMWALYRHPDIEMTQAEAHRASICQGPELAQSSLSRKIRQLDTRVLLEGTSDITAPFSHEEDLQGLYSDVAEEWREHAARTIVSARALDLIVEPDVETPEWARKQYPDAAERYDSRA